MPKNIVLLSDGTGNSSAKVFKTNVWRLYQLLELRDPTAQVAYYDDGVGTSSFKAFAVLGGVFGFGLKRNVIDIYSFCCRNYEEGDRIYCFGFSRGAFTIRIVTGMIVRQGLVPYNNDESELARAAADEYRLYRRRFNTTGGLVTPLRNLRDRFVGWGRKLLRQPVHGPTPKPVDSVHFVGLWDTVDAYGGPIEEMTRAIDYWIWPLSMPDRFMNAKVHKACHALALEDERDAFRPVIWDQRYVRGHDVVNGRKKTEWLFDINYHAPSETGRALETPPHLRNDLAPIDRERISQVWFTGVHADIGGGYPQDGLSFVTLDWMIDRATAYDMKVLPLQRRLLADPQVNFTDKLNNSREGVASYYRYKPRNLKDLAEALPYKPSLSMDFAHIWSLLTRTDDPQTEVVADLHPDLKAKLPDDPAARKIALRPPLATVHQSVFDRLVFGNDRYAPVVIPKDYQLTNKAGDVTLARPVIDQQPARSEIQSDAWNWIWLRRVVYFLCVFATLMVVMIPFWVIYFPGVGDSSVGPVVVPLINTAASFLPSFLQPWFDAFRHAPGLVLAGGLAIAALLWIGGTLQQTIRDVMRIGWHAPEKYRKPGGWHIFVHRLRRLGAYNAFFYILKSWIFPTGIIVWLFWWLAFGAANTLGLICKGKATIELTADKPIAVSPLDMQTSNICNATGIKVKEGEAYEVTLVVKDLWFDGTIDATPNGFGWAKTSWWQVPAIPYRRLIWSNWFATILRVGEGGLEEHLLDLKPGADKVWSTTFKPRRDGEVFLYVNDAVLTLPVKYDYFYTHNNKGSATVTLRKL
ncbi:DUF2235 domain-containing protein [Tardiphaga sp. 839_C3_N1_4]|jgi:uncharacterized protein (DUF2235 family)|uniref:DUF2235 domain-containing protein n=1 Tax=Tardiphaga sp. 839_C3_N1_4 TaxID=3240761 RepID=UPI003F20AFCE